MSSVLCKAVKVAGFSVWRRSTARYLQIGLLVDVEGTLDVDVDDCVNGLDVLDMVAPVRGSGTSSSAAQRVADKITVFGGQAAANHYSVATLAGGRRSCRSRLRSSDRLTCWSATPAIPGQGIPRDGPGHDTNWVTAYGKHVGTPTDPSQPTPPRLRWRPAAYVWPLPDWLLAVPAGCPLDCDDLPWNKSPLRVTGSDAYGLDAGDHYGYV